MRRLGLGQSEQLREQEIKARMRVAHAALAALEEIAGQREVPEDLLARLRGTYELRLSRLESGRHERAGEDARHDGPGVQEIRNRVIDAQRRSLQEIRAERTAAVEVLQRIEHDVDLEATRLGARI